MEQTPNLAKAIIKVMKAIKGIEKSMTVGSGSSAYQGVSDKDVKIKISEAMEENGLCILPISVEGKCQVDRWDETTQYGTKSKQSIFTEVTTKYLLLHESGESKELGGYGHGVDSQDKGAGKATTYALKNCLLYTFMVATGAVDDTDKTHSDELPVPPKNKQVTQKVELSSLVPGSVQWTDAVKYLQGSGTIEKIKGKYTLTPENEEKLKAEVLEAVA